MSQRVIGQILLNQYRVDEFIGSGSMSVVYRVWDLKRNTPLAMKILKNELADDPSVFKYFRRGAKALEKLAHPHIVPFYGLERTDDFAFALEGYIKGPSVKDILRQNGKQPLPILDALCIMRAVCSALGYAHANGVIHCDVKPGNIMVDSGGNIFLTDFGIARHADSTTTTMGAAGTPAYMAPEQIRGEVVTAATDVYAMGMMVYEMLTGRRPFEGKGLKTSSSQSGGTQADLIRAAHLNQPPPDPSTLYTNISPQMAAIMLKALNKNPQERFQDIMAFYSAIRSAAGFSPDQIPERLLKYVREPEPDSSPVPIAAVPLPEMSPRKKTLPLILGAAGLMLMIVIFVALNNGPKNPSLLDSKPPNADILIAARTDSTSEVTINPTSTNKLVPANTISALTPTKEQSLELAIGSTLNHQVDTTQMVFIPAGEFQMGCDSAHNGGFDCEDDALPLHPVYLDDYYIDKYEVTNKKYAKCVEAGVCQVWIADDYYNDPTYENYPVIYIDHELAQDFCAWEGKRLPTEAEWEKAAKGTTPKTYPWGDEEPNCQLTNYRGLDHDYCCMDINNNGSPSSVGSYPLGASSYGVHDMAGNVAEWVNDYYQYDYYSNSPYKNPKGPIASEHTKMCFMGGACKDSWVLRGGSYIDNEWAIKTTDRGTYADGGFFAYGFRCAADADYDPNATPLIRTPVSSCPGAPFQRLAVGENGKVCTKSDPIRLRKTPGKEGEIIASLKTGTKFEVIDGPQCAGSNWSWWKVKLDSGQVGWVAEGGDAIDPYFLCPLE